MSHAYTPYSILHFEEPSIVWIHVTFSNLHLSWTIIERFRIWIGMPGSSSLFKNEIKKKKTRTPPAQLGPRENIQQRSGEPTSGCYHKDQHKLDEWSQFGFNRNKCSEPWEIVYPLPLLLFLLAGFHGNLCLFVEGRSLSSICSWLKRISRRKR